LQKNSPQFRAFFFPQEQVKIASSYSAVTENQELFIFSRPAVQCSHPTAFALPSKNCTTNELSYSFVWMNLTNTSQGMVVHSFPWIPS